MNRYEAVFFDFDGTIADTSEGIIDCCKYAIKKEGLKQPDDALMKRFIGPPLFDTFKEFFPEISDELAQQLVVDYREKYSVEGIYNLKFYDGIIELLEILKDNGIKAAIVSGKPEKFIKQICSHFEIDKYFEVLTGTDPSDRNSDKTHLINRTANALGVENKSKILMVGDRKFDILGAVNAGTASAAVLFGFGNQQEFEEANADFIINNCEELRNIIFN